jgi:SAM-dependent methyltransferase
VARWAGLVPAGGRVLDLAAGGGRHGRLFRRQGHPVTFVDIDTAALADLADDPEAEIVTADLEAGPWPLAGRRFAGVVGVNYLWRPLLPRLIEAIEPGGALLYDTFAIGNERFGRPRNPAFLLRDGELLDLVHGRLSVRGYEMGEVGDPPAAIRQRIAAVHPA